MVEQQTENLRVLGSIPSLATIFAAVLPGDAGRMFPLMASLHRQVIAGGFGFCRRRLSGTLGVVLVFALVVTGAAGCASPDRLDRLERRVAGIEQRLEQATATGSVTTPTTTPSAANSVGSVDVEIARLRADIEDIRLLLLDLQMKAGR